ncbi:LamG-like jellyroll fold domain-containing protein, partial [Sphaerospermopsis sp. LEGE 08334]|uniref:LamG-like jellyroll fold domain-containing protein n=1 Tax=Sphaerospermopsis sp. LEGE 08334 TaxID=1828651 RepID=UPI00187F1163
MSNAPKLSVISFDGIDDYLVIANHNSINFDKNQNFCIELWLKIGKISPGSHTPFDVNIFEKWQGSVFPYAIRYSSTAGTVYGSRYDGRNPSISSKKVINDQKFHHVAFVKQDSQLFLYVDGVKESETQDTVIQSTKNDSPLYIAAGTSISKGGGTRRFFAGQIADIRLWNIARTPEEIKQNMNSRLRGNEPGLVGYYPLNGDANDKTGNANHGTINGAIWQQEEIPIADLTGGNELKSRGVCDTRTNFYLVDTNNPININGNINGWEVWADTIAPLQLIIYRKDGSSWSVVDKSDTKTPVVGLNQFSLSTPMTVKQGDFVGIYYPGGGSVSFNRTTDKEAWDLGNLTGKVLFTTTGAGATAFSGSSNRVYSIRVKGVAQVIQPTSEKTIPGVIGIGMNNQLYTRKTLTSNWEHIANSGSVLGITVMPDGTIVGIGMNNQLYTRKTLTSNWEHIANSGSVLGITVMPNGTIVGIGMNNQLYTRKTLTSNWEHIANSGSVLGITVMPDGTIVGIGMNNQLYT